MPYANNNGVRIFYEVEGEGPVVLLLHGFSFNREGWRQSGYVGALQAAYRLILPDTRGHGASDKPHDPLAYSPELLVGDVLAILDELNVAKVHSWGYSMGARIVRALGIVAPERASSLIMGGWGPRPIVHQAATPGPGEEALEEGIDAFVALLDKLSGGLSAVDRATLQANDPKALLACLRAQTEVEPKPLTMPCFIYAGEADPAYGRVKEFAAQMPHAKFVSFPRLNHGGAGSRSDLVIPHVAQFLAQMTTSHNTSRVSG